MVEFAPGYRAALLPLGGAYVTILALPLKLTPYLSPEGFVFISYYSQLLVSYVCSFLGGNKLPLALPGMLNYKLGSRP